MRRRIRLLAAAAALIAPAAVLARWSVAGDAAASPEASIQFPERIGAWTTRTEQRLDPVSLAMAAPDAHLVRRYEAKSGGALWLYVGFYAARAGSAKSAHDPEVCYPAHGWEVLATRTVSLRVGAEGFPAKRLDLHRGRQRESVVYWFQPAGRWPAHPAAEQLLRVGDALRGRPQYAFVRLSSAPAEAGGASAAELLEFAAAIALPVRDVVDAGG